MKVLILLLLSSLFFSASAQYRRAENFSMEQSIHREFFQGRNGGISYCRLDENMDLPGIPYLVLVLHGRSGSGDDNSRQLSSPVIQPLLDFVRSSRKKTVILVPQCPSSRDWLRGGSSSMLSIAFELAEQICRKYRIPPEKRFITGVSMGGGACYALMAEHPGFFSRAMIVSAGGRPETVARMRGDFYLIHGTADRLIPVERVERMVSALRRNQNCRVQLKLLRGKGHADGADAACTSESLKWLFDIAR